MTPKGLQNFHHLFHKELAGLPHRLLAVGWDQTQGTCLPKKGRWVGLRGGTSSRIRTELPWICHRWRQRGQRSSSQPAHRKGHQPNKRMVSSLKKSGCGSSYLDNELTDNLALMRELSSSLPESHNQGWECRGGRDRIKREVNGDNLTQYPQQEKLGSTKKTPALCFGVLVNHLEEKTVLLRRWNQL